MCAYTQGTTTFQVASSTANQCVCQIGFSGGGDDVLCDPCEAGTYKDVPGPVNCTSCAVGKFSAATQQTSEASCQHCPANTNTSAAKSTSLTHCLCNPGYTGDEGINITCSQCPIGTFKEISGAAACVACMAGTYQDTIGQTDCTQCVAGTYQDRSGQNSSISCNVCPSFTYSDIGSPNLTSCRCNVGYTGPNGKACTACPEGYFKSQNGSSACIACPAGTWSSSRAVTGCKLCPPDTYSTSIGAMEEIMCTRCPKFTISASGSSSEDQCLCAPGYSGPNGGNCSACEPGFEKPLPGNSTCAPCTLGTYSENRGSSQCLACPPMSTTNVPESTNRSQCLCQVGYSGDVSLGVQCSPCIAGTYKEVIGTAPCSECDSGKFSESVAANFSMTCVECPDPNQQTLGKGSPGLSSCQCRAGFTWNDDQKSCQMCVVGKFKIAMGNEACTDCAPGTFSSVIGANSSQVCSTCPPNSGTFGVIASSINDCQCIKGFTGSNGGPCIRCSAGTFKAMPGESECTNCSAGSFSNSTGSSACFDCPPGTYSSMIGAQGKAACQSCPGFQISLPGSASVTDCLCQPGYVGSNGALCTACQAGTFKNSTGNATCNECSIGSYVEVAAATACFECSIVFAQGYTTANTGSWNVTDCQCNRGLFMNGSSGCAPCSSGEFKSDIGNKLCDTCPSNSSSLPGSADRKSCECNPGFTGPDGGPCEICVAGKFKPRKGWLACSLCGAGKYSNVPGVSLESQCISCPANSDSEPGSSSLSNCSCNMGFTGSSGNCSSCVPGKYKTTMGSHSCADCEGGKFSEAAAATAEVACVSCPDNTFSEAGSNALSACSCNKGFTGSDGTCSSCTQGKYKPTIGPAACTDCPEGTYSGSIAATTVTSCLPCLVNTSSPPGSSTLSDCLCVPGFTGNQTGDLSLETPCTACPLGAYKNISGASECVACQAGKYANVLGMSACTICNDNSFSAAFSKSVASCRCNAGYTGAAGNCSACPAGSFKNKTGSANCTSCHPGTYSVSTGQIDVSACIRCPNNTFSPSGSKSLFDCSCNPGFSGNETICIPCDLGKYKPVLGDSDCVACAEGMYAETSGMAFCRSCPIHTHSMLGSTRLAECICNAGYTQTSNLYCDSMSSSSCFTEANCSSCIPGTYKSTNGSEPCTVCERGSYSNISAAVAKTQCRACPANSMSGPGSSSIADCICDPGYSGMNGICSRCTEGKYKPHNGSAPCTFCEAGKYSGSQGAVAESDCLSCPAHSTSQEGSISQGDCKCLAGWTGTSSLCAKCGKGTYKNKTGSESCTQCPDASGNHASTSPAQSDDVSDCKCNAGYYDSGTDGTLTCTQCPLNHTSELGSSDLSHCACNSGYTGPGAGACTGCELGKFKSSVGTLECTSCAKGQYSESIGQIACKTCPKHTTTEEQGSKSILACVCEKGKTNFFGPDGQECTLCPADTYKKSTGSQNCTACPFPSFSDPGSTQFDDCQCTVGGDCFACPTGSYRVWNGALTSCVECESGKYSSVIGATSPDDCSSCPLFSTSESGAPSIMNCSCALGYESVVVGEGFECRPCAIGFYKNWLGPGSCLMCPPLSSTAVEQSSSINDCSCLQGFSGHHNNCSACDRGKYKSELGTSSCKECGRDTYGESYNASSASACLQCPQNTTSMAGSWQISNCSCIPGFHGSNGGPCASCPPNTYKELAGESDCLPCPYKAVSSASSAHIHDCLCDKGHYGRNGSTCTTCEQGKYKDKTGPMNCTLCSMGKFSNATGQDSEMTCRTCPPNSTSNLGGRQDRDCVCIPGFFGKNGSTCTACNSTRFKTQHGEAPDGTEADCKACPDNSWSPKASPHCLCNVGYEGPDQGESRDKNCSLCAAGTYKNWRGSGECEACHERIKPPENSEWVPGEFGPTDPLKGCNWKCSTATGYFYPLKDSLDGDLQSFIRPVEIAEPEWFSWYALRQYQVTAPKEYYHDVRRYLPNTCAPCDITEPSANPCGYGEYWDSTPKECPQGCTPCKNTDEVSCFLLLPSCATHK